MSYLTQRSRFGEEGCPLCVEPFCAFLWLKNFLKISKIPLDLCRICSRIDILDGQALVIYTACLAVVVLKRC
jgi:hypothetical protein